jgi:hypothetical protein
MSPNECQDSGLAGKCIYLDFVNASDSGLAGRHATDRGERPPVENYARQYIGEGK